MRKIDIIHIFIYLMIFIILSNWFINIIIIGILQIVLMIMFWIFIDLVIINRKLKKENKKLIKKYKR